jgi:hypothetical protein
VSGVMGRTTMRKFVMGVALAMAPLASVSAEQGSLPTWLAGCWKQVEGERWVEECWMAPRGDIMLGAGRAGRGDALTNWEAMQIGRNSEGILTFWASPDGAPRVAFTLQAQSPEQVTFVNRAHDYPQRVRYWRDGRLLRAEVAKADGSDAQGFTFTPHN